jgi:hypothetical protein
MKKMIIFLCLIIVLAGCTKGNKTPAKNAEGSNTIDVAQGPAPQYIAESGYEGDELGIVQTLNLYMKAFYERDHEAFYKLLSKDNTWKIDAFQKYFVSIDKLDFSVKPDPVPPKDVKLVVLEFRVKYDDHEDVENNKQKQLFSFRLEDGFWKLTGISDYWT